MIFSAFGIAGIRFRFQFRSNPNSNDLIIENCTQLQTEFDSESLNSNEFNSTSNRYNKCHTILGGGGGLYSERYSNVIFRAVLWDRPTLLGLLYSNHLKCCECIQYEIII